MKTKICTKCKVDKPITEFWKRSDRDGPRSACKPCSYDRKKIWEYNLEKNYGISVEEYNRMFEDQSGCCAICLKPYIHEFHKKLSVDHCHVTGLVRGLLCHPCNAAIGSLGDDPDRIRRAADYVESNGFRY